MIVLAFGGKVITEANMEGLMDIVMSERPGQSITQLLFCKKLLPQVTTVEDMLDIELWALTDEAREEGREERRLAAPNEAERDDDAASVEVLDMTPEHGSTTARPAPERERRQQSAREEAQRTASRLRRE